MLGQPNQRWAIAVSDSGVHTLTMTIAGKHTDKADPAGTARPSLQVALGLHDQPPGAQQP